MRLQVLTSVLLWGILTTALPVWADIQVSAQVDRTSVPPGESLQLEVKISGGNGDVDISPITDFKAHSRGTSSSVQIINSRMTKEVIHHFLLVPLRQGKLTIPPLTVTADGQRHRTTAIAISVAKPTDNDTPKRSGNKDVWVSAEVSNDAPFAAQQITYTFRLYNAVQLDDAKFQSPEFPGFSAKEIEARRSYRKIINGREHVVNEVFFVLTPLKKGSLTIDPAVVHVGIVRQDDRRKRNFPFDSFFNQGIVEPRVLQTDPIPINVRSLPPLPPPQKFSGLVGQFALTAQMENTELKVGDSATLALTLKGRGNIMDAQPPDFKLPPAFKIYTDSPEENIDIDRNGTSGKKVFRTALVPVKPGVFTLPPIDVIYFDVEKKNYRTLRTEVPTINVVAVTTPKPQNPTNPPPSLVLKKKKVAFTGRDILPLKESLSALQPALRVQWPLFLLLIASPGLIFFFTIIAQKMRHADTSAKALMKSKSRKALKSAPNSREKDFLSFLYQALTAAIFAAANRKGEALTWKEAETLLLQNNFPEEDASQAAKLLSDIESRKFSGNELGQDQYRKLLGQTRKMVRKLAP